MSKLGKFKSKINSEVGKFLHLGLTVNFIEFDFTPDIPIYDAFVLGDGWSGMLNGAPKWNFINKESEELIMNITISKMINLTNHCI